MIDRDKRVRETKIQKDSKPGKVSDRRLSSEAGLSGDV